jgi:hypothetical protein
MSQFEAFGLPAVAVRELPSVAIRKRRVVSTKYHMWILVCTVSL